MQAVTNLAAHVTRAPACEALGLPRASFYRWRAVKPARAARPTPVRALSEPERTEVLEILHAPRFVDQAPPQVYAALLDDGRYLCSIRTMYRILNQHGEVRERRDQLRRPVYARPELLATAPNQVWSWNITKLRGPHTWTYYSLYVMLDIFSRYVVGWLIAERELAALAETLIAESVGMQSIQPGQLTVHSDRGAPMTAKCTAMLLADLGVTKSHGRPHVSDDNCFSEAQFKTLKYRPEFPDRFGSIQDARAFGRVFFAWYNTQHHHSALGLMTPHDVHHGRHVAITARRRVVLNGALERHPERFVRKHPTPPIVPDAVWINPPACAEEGQRAPLESIESRDALILSDKSASNTRTGHREASEIGSGANHALPALAGSIQ